MNPTISNAITRYILIYIAFSLGFAVTLNAQQTIFTPATENISLLTSLTSKLEKNYQQELESLPSKNKKDFEEIYKMRWENVKEKFDNKEIYTQPEAQKYLDAITAEIVKANPELKNKAFNCYFSRSGVPNASYIGEGIILFNMGLFKRLDNESQVAFVLCHELAHYYLQHTENSINKWVADINSEELQKQLRNIKKQEYNKREQLEKLVKGFTFNSRRHSRDHESGADSMALVFMRNTKFDLAESLSTLAILDKIDLDTLKTDACLERTFNAPDFPFQKKWIAKEEGLLGGHAILKEDTEIEDSLKTHPDCKSRIAKLEPGVKRYRTNTTKDFIDRSRFEQLRNTFKYEIVEYAFKSNNYTRSLSYSLELLQENPADPYLVTQVGKIMNGCYKAQKEHKLSKMIDMPAPYYRPNYNLLLQFIQNLYLDDYASISYHYLKQYESSLKHYAPFMAVYNASIQIAKD